MKLEALRMTHMYSSNGKRLLALGLGILAVISPLYIDRRRVIEPDPDEEIVTISSSLPQLILILIIAAAIIRGVNRFSSYNQRVVAIGLTVLAVVSPLYISRSEPELEEQSTISSYLLPLLLLGLIIAIAVSGYFDGSFTRFDAYWIHRVGGSSTGILILLLILALVLKLFKV